MTRRTWALYLFPTKALAHDQMDEIEEWKVEIAGSAIHNSQPAIRNLFISTDGDTLPTVHASVKRIILLIPICCTLASCPITCNGREIFSGLRYIVIDEMHTYRRDFWQSRGKCLASLATHLQLYGSQPLPFSPLPPSPIQGN